MTKIHPHKRYNVKLCTWGDSFYISEGKKNVRWVCGHNSKCILKASNLKSWGTIPSDLNR